MSSRGGGGGSGWGGGDKWRPARVAREEAEAEAAARAATERAEAARVAGPAVAGQGGAGQAGPGQAGPGQSGPGRNVVASAPVPSPDLPWSQRFLDVLGSFGMADAVKRGRVLVRGGRVMSFSVSSSLVVALVAGERDGQGPFRARIAVRRFDDGEWAAVEEALAGRAVFVAKLLAGTLPPGVEGVFGELGLSLLPRGSRELGMDCSCPAWEVPCEHLAAACQVLASALDDDPFTLLAWRGRERDELLDRLRASRAPGDDERSAPPLAAVLDSFWVRPPARAASVGQDALTGADVSGQRVDSVLDELGELLVDERPVRPVLRELYRRLPGRG
ncbi:MULTISPECIES: SWIM zinc finger family protein [Actinosynnema]|uniref:SWIM zinc finger family protein n=1 Tax=Actinosynnema TaxID=40566 RepID=UPI0020A4FD7E|nr:SWIM zinc finger family protein [Actinosynnema pretiosum]MCP2092844.1 putative conserved protein, contains Zn finger domain [Actinosynnema pretiosum]